MLMLKEAIGTCYFCHFPGSLGLAGKVLIGGVIRRCMDVHGGFVKPEWGMEVGRCFEHKRHQELSSYATAPCRETK